MPKTDRIRVLYSFPNKLGGTRICYTAWQQVNGLAAAGADVLVFPASTCRPVPDGVQLEPTLARGNMRIPFKLLGHRNARILHDYIVAGRLEKLRGQVDIVHTWPSGALSTLKAATKLGIPTVLERCNSHTRYVYEVVGREAKRIGIELSPGDEAAFNENKLRLEEQEFRLADRLLCPSEFVVQTFIDRGFPHDRLARHTYGFDEENYWPLAECRPNDGALRMLFVGAGVVRKGVHYALEAWLQSTARLTGTFSLAGEFAADYAAKLSPMLSHPSVRVLGYRKDVPQLMRNHDVLVLPSLEEGSPLVCIEAMASGCVPLVSDAGAGVCQHMQNALVHRVGDVDSLKQHIDLLDKNRNMLQELRVTGVRIRNSFTWKAAGSRLLEVYRETIAMHSKALESSLASLEPV